VSLRVHIERLVLDGVDVGPAERPALQAALETELARLLAEGGLSRTLATGGAIPSLRSAPLELAHGSTPAALGTAIAGAVHGELGGRR
jgi:hypothetical protein